MTAVLNATTKCLSNKSEIKYALYLELAADGMIINALLATTTCVQYPATFVWYCHFNLCNYNNNNNNNPTHFPETCLSIILIFSTEVFNCRGSGCNRSEDADERTGLRTATLHLYLLNATSQMLTLIHCAWNSCIVVSHLLNTHCGICC